ncbi:hypothetical protein Ga0074812_1563 [Parafrankia irregularis]|uniref:Uncharacterized protein n=1 Tax=Parafrankia irregularis TaxID=795642 RepID=A0A0S4R0N2_9ACTN|nr:MULTISPECIES: hypothetical protein [Parafrankia]MBE3204369.1 hypothetical protein [Parafrankia sp. CH37]CUU61092.1 hypothetical protein Ga0074812_1563 [Parafrankia irregularis]
MITTLIYGELWAAGQRSRSKGCHLGGLGVLAVDNSVVAVPAAIPAVEDQG